MSVVLSGAWIAQLLTAAAGLLALLAAFAVLAPAVIRLVRERLANDAEGNRASSPLAPLPIAWVTASTLRRLVPLAIVARPRAPRAPPGRRPGDLSPAPADPLPIAPRAFAQRIE